MEYDPIKRRLGHFFNRSPWLRRLFYFLLDLLLLRSWHIRKEIKTWAHHMTGGAAVLDAGAGFGQYSYYLARKWPGMIVTGVDVKKEEMADCQHFFERTAMKNASFHDADLLTYKQEKTYDLILCVDVMEHIEKDTVVFENFAASLKPGGMLLISTPSDRGGSDVHHHGEGSFIGEHVREGYNAMEMVMKLTRAGFKRTEVRYAYGVPGNLAWRLSMKYPMMMLSCSKWFFVVVPFYYLIIFPFFLSLNFLDLELHHTSGTGLIVKAWT
jgi:2-polyprenyl-3-methyl-5-hydroxy-6-metoxy-1,4-benzoquinol methylase